MASNIDWGYIGKYFRLGLFGCTAIWFAFNLNVLSDIFTISCTGSCHSRASIPIAMLAANWVAWQYRENSRKSISLSSVALILGIIGYLIL